MLVDSHCHLDMLDLSNYDGKLDKAIHVAYENDVGHILSVCVKIEDFPNILKNGALYQNVTCTVGLHPSEQNCHEPTIDELVEFAQHPKVIAIGETGLDYFHCSGDLRWQQNRFRNHIQAAKMAKIPLVLHSRQSSEDLLRILKEEGADEVGGVWHCFTETDEIVRQALDFGLYIGITGIVTFKKAIQLQEIAKQIPLDRMLIETDAPYLAPTPMRGQKNEPAFVRYVAEYVAQLRDISYEEVARQTTTNFCKLMDIDL